MFTFAIHQKKDTSMLVAREKLKTNIVEYILYMYHIEDMIRANHFSIDELETTIISKYAVSPGQQEEIRSWYKDLIAQMKKDDVLDEGHLSALREMIFNLNDLHLQLINTLGENLYLEQYQFASPFIKELKDKMNKPELTEIEVCFNGLYGFMLLKMKGKPVTEETSEAMVVFSQLLRYLSKKFHERI
jgi:hypothetical protein